MGSNVDDALECRRLQNRLAQRRFRRSKIRYRHNRSLDETRL